MGLNYRTEKNQPLRFTEGDIEALKDISSPNEIEADSEAWRESDEGSELDGTDFHGKAMEINGNLASVADGGVGFSCLREIDSQPLGIRRTENTETCSGVNVTPDLTPANGAFDLEGDDGSWKFSVEKAVLKAYNAQLKSSGRGIGRPVGMTPGCFRRASFSRRAASVPTNNSPSATTAYWPAYRSTSSLKCLRTHSRSSIFFVLLPFLRFIGSRSNSKNTKRRDTGQAFGVKKSQKEHQDFVAWTRPRSSSTSS